MVPEYLAEEALKLMTTIHSTRMLLGLAGAVFGVTLMIAAQPASAAAGAAAQAAPGAPGPGGGGRGRGGLPGATPEQTQAVADMSTALAALNTAVTTARSELATATFADVKNEVAIRGAVEKLRVAELALASKRAEEFAKLQAGPNKLNPEQITALIAAGGNLPAAGRGGRGAAGPEGTVTSPAPGAPSAPAGRGRGGAMHGSESKN